MNYAEFDVTAITMYIQYKSTIEVIREVALIIHNLLIIEPADITQVIIAQCQRKLDCH